MQSHASQAEFENPIAVASVHVGDADMFELLVTLQIVARTLRAHWDRELRAAIPDMNAARATVIMQLARSGGSSQVRLAKLLGFSQMALTRVLNDLERLRWVQREPVPADRRVWAVRLTSDGREKLSAVHVRAHDFARRHCAGIDEDLRQSLIATLVELKSR